LPDLLRPPKKFRSLSRKPTLQPMISKKEDKIAIKIRIVKAAATTKKEATTKVVKKKTINTIEETTVTNSTTNAQLKTDGAPKKMKWFKS